MDTATWVLIVCAVVFLMAAGAGLWLSYRQRQHERLRRQFGPEYERAVGEYGDTRAAEESLRSRQRRVEKLRVRPLAKEERARFGARWSDAQARFVEDPRGAVQQAQSLNDDVMRVRGFPLGDFDQRAADISVQHPYVVESYRSASTIAERAESGDADTEQLRQAFVHFRTLFRELTNVGGGALPGEREAPIRPTRVHKPT
jgi:hypothetical protein